MCLMAIDRWIGLDPNNHWERTPLLLDFLQSPLRFLLQIIYHNILLLRGPAYHPPSHGPLKVICISDTHCKTEDIPPGDLLIHAGDFANAGTAAEITKQFDWLSSLPHTHKIVISGNHDGWFDPRTRVADDKDAVIDHKHYAQKGSLHYLQHSSITLTFPSRPGRSFKIYGAPQTPNYDARHDWAFGYPPDKDAWTGTIPRDTDILITHTPPRWHCDLSHGMGDENLLREIWRVRPSLHVFGHIHWGVGKEYAWWDETQAAYERIMRRGKRGIMRDAFNIGSMVDGARLAFYGGMGIIWNRIWGGDTRGSILVNGALSVGSTGRLGNRPSVVYL